MHKSKIIIYALAALLILVNIISGGIITSADNNSLGSPEGTLTSPALELELNSKTVKKTGEKKYSISMTWDDVEGASGYNIIRGNSKIDDGKKITDTDNTEYTDKNIEKGRTYYYQLYAYSGTTDNNGIKIFSEKSTPAHVTIPENPPVVKEIKTTGSSCTISWNKVKRALSYNIYRKDSKDGNYKCIKKNYKKNEYTDKKLKEKTSYTYQVCAVAASKEKVKYITDMSNSLTVSTSKKNAKIAIVGDSIIEQLGHYNLIKGKNRKMIAKIGVSPSTFYNNVLMDDLLDYDPDRMYILLGMNSIEGKPSDALLKNVAGWFKKILKECLKENHDMQIIVLPVPPVRPGSTASNSIIKKYNGLLKTMASDLQLPYYDYTPEMSEKDGTLKSEYAEGDKMHWKFNGCSKFMELLNAYDKENY